MKYIIKKLVPRPIRHMLRCARILGFDYGYIRSVRKFACIDKDDKPLPWYTYPTIEYLNQLDFRDKILFEYGAGNSTKYWSERVKHVYSIENDESWFEQVRDTTDTGKVTITFENDINNYTNTIHKYGMKFDIVVVDSEIEGDPGRVKAATAALSSVKDNGMIIMDNSDWYVDAAKLLNESGMLQVDFKGFGPINKFTWTTSIFFSREWDVRSLDNHQPSHGIGSVEYYRHGDTIDQK